MNLVTEGLKLQQCSPGFISGRNAILQADQLLYGGAYSCSIWEAFRRRGMGPGASEGSTGNLTDQVPDFNLFTLTSAAGAKSFLPSRVTPAIVRLSPKRKAYARIYNCHSWNYNNFSLPANNPEKNDGSRFSIAGCQPDTNENIFLIQ